MIILRLSGGLGNQMFQYAFGRATSRHLGVEMLLEVSDPTLSIHNGFELDRVFNIDVRIATESDMRAVLGWQRLDVVRKIIKKIGLASFFLNRCIVEPHFYYSHAMRHVPDGTFLCGYWQSEKYFADESECIRDEFRFREPPSGVNKELVQEIAASNGAAISLHVRRGDYVHNQAVSQVHGSCSLAYYRAAIQRVLEQVQNPFFYVFSDDIEWVRTHLEMPFPHRFIAHNRDKLSCEDMRLMSLCQHHIIANSSFSWWGAWLNPAPEKIVVAPKNWFADECRPHDLFPWGWVVL
ncbi:alpha-1,2-fucosyltransferase [Thiovibrio frasassiensis]|uniref:Alpha-1,2-fucosyltransferase n=1 Tax=Thiovibrio frasassiensis TaxID=2984131 RepID=A0A9X4MHN4_9BACT|nr:alpha-1,2-fucosyltransferase [Thiovibrio frasassiensis]MDG4476035.1 alpha-1,2-fucosyltransferase [Thiovibrio frasassiensis]